MKIKYPERKVLTDKKKSKRIETEKIDKLVENVTKMTEMNPYLRDPEAFYIIQNNPKYS